MQMTLKILLAGTILMTMNTCTKTYEDGPAISLRSKMNRITGKWRLVSMEGVPRLNPDVEQYIELSKEEALDGCYKATFVNFQEEFCTPDSTNEALFTSKGKWTFFDGDYGFACNITEELEKKEGLRLYVDTLKDNKWEGNEWVGSAWKIFKLTNKELKIGNGVCLDNACFYMFGRTLIFEKE